MIFPGFVTLYKDSKNLVHLYFYPGIDNFNQYYYNKLDLSESHIQYQEIKYKDGAYEYIFKANNIIKVTCKLISKYNDIEYKTFQL